MPNAQPRSFSFLNVPAEGGSIYGSPKRPAKPDYKIDHETGCWVWQKGLTPTGYPHRYAHRAYYQRAYGVTVPKGWHTHHECRNRACVNPEHLHVHDPRSHWSMHGREKRKLTAREGAEIRGLCLDPDLTYGDIAERYGVSYQQVCDLAMGNRWEGDYKGGPIVRPVRACLGCGEPVPEHRRRHARYCTDECKVGSRWNRLTPEQRAARAEWQRKHRAKKREAASV